MAREYPNGQSVRGDTKFCSTCREWKPLETFSPARTKTSGYESCCKPCRNPPRRVELAPITQAVLDYKVRSGESWSTLARRAGMVHAGVASTSTFQRRAGVRPEAGRLTPNRRTSYDVALTLCHAINADPVDLDL